MNRNVSLLVALVVVCSSVSAQTREAAGPPAAAVALERTLRDNCARFSRFDMDGDAIEDIHRLQLLKLAPSAPSTVSRGLVVVLLEDRLSGLVADVALWLKGIVGRGWSVALVTASVYGHEPKEDRHQDGRTVLALREFLRGVGAGAPTLRGVLLVGNFPDALIVRQCAWPQGPGSLVLSGRTLDDVRWVDDRSGLLAFNSDIVLADLDGRWEMLYAQAPTTVRGFIAAFPAQGPEFDQRVSRAVEYFDDTWTDAFIVRDGDFRAEDLGDGSTRLVVDGPLNRECSKADLALANPLAMPELRISRINAKRVGVKSNPAVRGLDKEGLVGTDGRPGVVRFAPGERPAFTEWWVQSPEMEGVLLARFFERVQSQRAGAYRAWERPAALAWGFGSAMPHIRDLFKAWQAVGNPADDLVEPAATLEATVAWLRRPAALRALETHANGFGFSVGPSVDADAVARAIGGTVWSWRDSGDDLIPGLATQNEVGFPVLRSLWANGRLPGCGVVYYVAGCESIAPPWSDALPFNDRLYGYLQGAESLLFYGSGVALIGRSKVFNERPDGFLEALAEGADCGTAWLRFYRTVAEHPDPAEVYHNIARKRPYIWSLLGDWTVGVVGPADGN